MHQHCSGVLRQGGNPAVLHPLQIRNCKLCQDDKGIVVGGEYGITSTLLKNGYNVATLMSRYARVRSRVA